MAGVHEWTRAWWESLPEVYKNLDAVQNSELGGYPLLKWMDGVGSVAGGFRQISDDLYNGVYTDPDLVPNSAVHWLALMLGVRPEQRSLPPAELRMRIKSLVSSGRPVVGTRQSIEETVNFLIPGSVAWVHPHDTLPHVLVLYMREIDLQGGTVEQIRQMVMVEGVIPAGHDLVVVVATPSWDAWEAAVGKTWTELEGNVPRWVDSDSVGVVPE